MDDIPDRREIGRGTSAIQETTNVLPTLEVALAKAPQAILVLDSHENIVMANAAAHDIFGHEPGELVGLPVARVLPTAAGPHSDLLKRLWRDRPDNATISESLVTGVRKDGTPLILDIGAGLVPEGDSSYVVASLVDVSERLDLEARLAAASNEQLGFQRLIGDIAANLVEVPAADVDVTITNSLRQVGEALQIDRVIVWQVNPGTNSAVATHYWTAAADMAPSEGRSVTDLPWVMSRLTAGEACWFTSLDDIPDPLDRESFRRKGPRSGLAFPLALYIDEQRVLGVLALSTMTQEREWVPSVRERLRLVAGVISQALARKEIQRALDRALEEIRQLNNRLDEAPESTDTERIELRRAVKATPTSHAIVAESPAIKRALGQMEQVAPTPATVLLLGETGVGKEVFAQALHDLSPRHRRQMVRVSCAAIPPALIENELFGRERGAYTGALSRQIGRFEAANQSTLFLDEIGELPLEVQVKLLRVLQERVVERLGSTQQIKVDVRIIAATNRNLEEAVNEGKFREDLFYRLNVFPIFVPALRDRVEDIPGLIWAFIDEFSRLFGKDIDSVSKESMRELQGYAWPGNVRELRNVVERAVILAARGPLILQAPKPSGRAVQTAQTLEALEIRHIRSVLESTNWRVRGRGGAAERLGLKPTTLESRMARLGITRRRAS